ncbi:MAG: radical SAM protein [Bacteriovoracaceae bacterium]
MAHRQFTLVSSLYLHFPFCLHLCNYCDFFRSKATADLPKIGDYFDYLNASVEVQRKLLDEHAVKVEPLTTFYIGGGTPSLWGVRGPLFLKDFFQRQEITLATKGEFTLEVNPKAWDDASIKSWMDFGINRFSIGVQSFNQHLIKYLDRFHSMDDVVETLSYFRYLKANFSVDLMLGIPYSQENKRDIIGELTELLKYNPSHFSIYILTTKSNYTYNDAIPDEDFIQREYLLVSEFLQQHGFNHYEVSNFAKPGFESHHNLKYWKLESVLAYGPSATGLIYKNREEAIRYKWDSIKPLPQLELLQHKELILEEIYLSLRTNQVLNLKRFNLDLKQVEPFFDYLVKNDFGKPSEQLILNSKGFLMMDSVMNELFKLKELWSYKLN